MLACYMEQIKQYNKIVVMQCRQLYSFPKWNSTSCPLEVTIINIGLHSHSTADHHKQASITESEKYIKNK